MRLLFSSIHCYLDPSSGAALCTRELLELLAARGMDCRVLTTGVLDPERETTLDEVLATLELPCQRFWAELGAGRAAEVIDLSSERRAGDAHADDFQPRRSLARPAGGGGFPRDGRPGSRSFPAGCAADRQRRSQALNQSREEARHLIYC